MTDTVGVVTGAGRGMGAACARRLASTVDVVLLVDRDETLVTEVAASLEAAGPARVEPWCADVTAPADLDGLAARVAELGTLRSCVHAAGVSPAMADWETILRVDLVGTALLVEALRPLVTPGAGFVCFASMAPYLDPSERNATAESVLDAPLAPDLLPRLREAVGPALEDPGLAYVWAKRGVQRLVRREAMLFGRVGARICSVSPGVIDTPMGRQEADTQPEINDVLLQLTPLARQGRAEEVANVVAFLLSAEAGYVTGTDVVVDGGTVAGVTSGASTG